MPHIMFLFSALVGATATLQFSKQRRRRCWRASPSIPLAEGKVPPPSTSTSKEASGRWLTPWPTLPSRLHASKNVLREPPQLLVGWEGRVLLWPKLYVVVLYCFIKWGQFENSFRNALFEIACSTYTVRKLSGADSDTLDALKFLSRVFYQTKTYSGHTHKFDHVQVRFASASTCEGWMDGLV